MTDAEIRLCHRLRRWQLAGYKFRRQPPIWILLRLYPHPHPCPPLEEEGDRVLVPLGFT
ncbi:MAG: hypothetical protein WAO71_05580 [Gallionella sp.]